MSAPIAPVARRPLTSNPRAGSPAWLSLIAGALIVVACTGPAAPSGSPSVAPTGSAASPTTGSPAPSDSPSPGASATPVPSPTALTDGLAAIPATEGVLNALWLGEDRAIAGGFRGPGFVPTIIVFQNGTWTPADVPETIGQVHAIAEFGGRLFAVGDTLPDVRSGFIWESTDGASWTVAQTVDDAAIYDIAATDGAVVAVGALLTDEMVATAAAWVSTDGAAWERAEVDGAAKVPMGTVTATSAGFVATGDRPLGEDRPFWTSPDATSWTPVANNLNPQYLPVDIAPWGERIVMVGASGRSGDQHPFVAVTGDGAAWDQRILSREQEGYASAVTVVDDAVFAAGLDGDALVLWTISDGDATSSPIEPGGAAIGSLRWDADWGLVGAGSKDQTHAVWSLTAP